MNYLQKKKLAFMSIVNQVKGFVRTVMGALPLTLEGCVDENSITDYKIYGQSVQDGEPTPDNPVEVESVGEKTKNLINWDYLLSDTTITKVGDGYYSETYYHQWGSTSELVKQLKSVLKPDVTYTLSRLCDLKLQGGSTGNIVIYNADGLMVSTGVWEGLKSTTFTFTQEQIDSIVGIRVYFATQGIGCTVSEIQLTESDTVLLYEPYGKYKIPVTVSGNNLFNETHASIFENWTPVDNRSDMARYIMNLPIGTYTARCNNLGLPTSANFSLKKIKTNGSVLDVYKETFIRNGQVSDPFTISEGEYLYISLYIEGSNSISKNVGIIFKDWINDFVICEGSYTSETMPEYEPYHEPITTNIFLDEPLRKVGNNADYIDFENGKVVRNVIVEKLDSSKKWTMYSDTQSDVLGFYYNNTILHAGGHCNILPKHTSDIAYGGQLQVNSECYYPAYQYIKIVFAKSRDVSSVATLKTYLDSINAYAVCRLITPTESPITLPDIPTFKGTTILTADTTVQPSQGDIKYFSTQKGE